jgi:hypothetical protein
VHQEDEVDHLVAAVHEAALAVVQEGAVEVDLAVRREVLREGEEVSVAAGSDINSLFAWAYLANRSHGVQWTEGFFMKARLHVSWHPNGKSRIQSSEFHKSV